jgi:L-lactate dehydrogenase complex protein LldF
MTHPIEQFKTKSASKAIDLLHRQKILFNIGKYDRAVVEGKKQFQHLDAAREKAKNTKWRAIEQLDRMLEDFERNFVSRGGRVIWAENAKQATDAILAICKEKRCRSVVKSKSMVTEEIHLNEILEENDIESVETDLGEYIQQLDGEAPYHIVTPAMHKSKEDVARLFAEKLGTDPNLNPEQLTQVARKILRKKYKEAEIGITGANFIIPDIGGIAITENEGNARLSCAFPDTHIAIVGIEKVLTSMDDLSLFWPLLSTFGTGQNLTVYNSIVTGPRQKNETDGPSEMIVILLDNGRTEILKDPVQRQSLYCIRCGACLNACPVYKNIGGHAYGTTYSGPIGSVITPNLRDAKEYNHLSFASSLCGNCTEVCAVKIELHELLLDNRHKASDSGMGPVTEKWAWKAWKLASLHRGLMNSGNSMIKNKVINTLFSNWSKERAPLSFSPKTFNQLWKDKEKNKQGK